MIKLFRGRTNLYTIIHRISCRPHNAVFIAHKRHIPGKPRHLPIREIIAEQPAPLHAERCKSVACPHRTNRQFSPHGGGINVRFHEIARKGGCFDLFQSNRLSIRQFTRLSNEKRHTVIYWFLLIDNEPNTGYAQSSMYDYYKSAGEDSLATILRDEIMLSSKTPVKTKLTMLQQLIRNSEKAGGDSTEILSVLNKMIEANPKETDVAMLGAVYMSVKKMPQDTINALYRHILNVEPDNFNARLNLIEQSWRKKNWSEVVGLCSTGVQYNPNEMAFYYYMGIAYYLHEDEDGALDAFSRGVVQITDKTDPNLASDMYCVMGDILHKKGRVEEAYEAYDKCLHWKEDNLQCLNNYAYFLSQEGGDLKKAESMSLKTIKAEPNNVNNLDTYAWILFLQERYEESKIYIDQALRNDTDSVPNAVILEHAGDIYMMTGRTDEALDYWKKALATGEGTALLNRKIKQKKYIPDEKK